MNTDQDAPSGRLVNRTVTGIIAATFLSDVSHEMCTAVLPMYLAAIGLGPSALGLIEGIADLASSLAKLGGGMAGHHVRRKQPLAAAGYLVTAAGTAGMALARGLVELSGLRLIAWVGRGFRSPLRDFLLADAVPKERYGRVYGLERAGDMLGAVIGPLIAVALVAFGWSFQTIILLTIIPGVAAAASMAFVVRERPAPVAPSRREDDRARAKFPVLFWLFLGGVTLFGLGDFSRTFLVWLAADRLGSVEDNVGLLALPVLMYVFHNMVSAIAAYPAGSAADRRGKLPVLAAGYGLGVLTNAILALFTNSFAWLLVAVLLSGVYIAVEETVERAVAADLLPRELRSLGLGILACCNALGDMVSSLGVGFLLEAGRPGQAFGLAAGIGALGFIAMTVLAIRVKPAAAAS